MIGDDGLQAGPGMASGTFARSDDPRQTEQILWHWIPFGTDDAIRRPVSVLGWTVAALALGAIALHIFAAVADPACTGRLCSRGYFTGSAALLASVVFLSFPWIGAERRALLTGSYSLTDAHFVKTRWREVISCPLRDGRIVIRYGCAWFERLSGTRTRLTPRMGRAEATRLFAAVAEARAVQRNRERT